MSARTQPPDPVVHDIRVHLPRQLRDLARVTSEVVLPVAEPVTLAAVLAALESTHPVLRGAIRAHGGGRRRAFVRFFACKEDLSHSPVDDPLPEPVVRGDEPLLVIGAMAGG